MMKTMSEEVVLKIPADRAWRMYRNDQIMSKINPKMLSNASYVQGDGGVGSLRLFKLGPSVNNYVKESYQKIEKVEEDEVKSVTYQVVGGELASMYNPYRVTFSFKPYKGGGFDMCLAGWKVEFSPLSPSIPPPEQAKDAALEFLKCFDKASSVY